MALTDKEKYEYLKSILEEIRDYDVRMEHGCIDEWEEAAAFTICQNKAEEALELIEEIETK